ARVGDVDQALAAVGRRDEQRVVAEPGNLDAQQLGRPDDQGALGHADLEPVDRAGHQLGLYIGRGHRSPHTVDFFGSNGQPPTSKCLRYSSRKYFTDEWIGLVAPSPSAQNERPRMLSAMSVMVARSSSVPWPASSRLSTS